MPSEIHYLGTAGSEACQNRITKLAEEYGVEVEFRPAGEHFKYVYARCSMSTVGAIRRHFWAIQPKGKE